MNNSNSMCLLIAQCMLYRRVSMAEILGVLRSRGESTSSMSVNAALERLLHFDLIRRVGLSTYAITAQGKRAALPLEMARALGR